MTFSVVIPAFNGEKYIEHAILSALHQTRKADEIIVHDDNSRDSTAAICKKYSAHVKYFLNENGPSGFVNGWNKAVSLARFDYIAILHQDDVLYPNFLLEAEAAFLKFPGFRHLFSLCNYISDSGNIISNGEEAVKEYFTIGDKISFSGQDYAREYQKSYPGIAHVHRCPGVITHRSIFESGCYYNPEAGHIADDDFFYRVGQYTSVIGIIKSLAAYRIHLESETGRIGDINLVARLSQDYLFQVKQWKDSSWLPKETLSFFVNNAYKYTNRLLGYGIRKLKFNLIKSALKNLDKIENEGFLNNIKCIKRLSNLSRLIRFFPC